MNSDKQRKYCFGVYHLKFHDCEACPDFNDCETEVMKASAHIVRVSTDGKSPGARWIYHQFFKQTVILSENQFERLKLL